MARKYSAKEIEEAMKRNKEQVNNQLIPSLQKTTGADLVTNKVSSYQPTDAKQQRQTVQPQQVAQTTNPKLTRSQQTSSDTVMINGKEYKLPEKKKEANFQSGSEYVQKETTTGFPSNVAQKSSFSKSEMVENPFYGKTQKIEKDYNKRTEAGDIAERNALAGAARYFVDEYYDAAEGLGNVFKGRFTNDVNSVSRKQRDNREAIKRGLESHANKDWDVSKYTGGIVPYALEKYVEDKAKKDANFNSKVTDAKKTAIDMGLGIGDMISAQGASLVAGPIGGAAVMAGRAANEAYIKKIDQGMEPKKAAQYASTVGFLEGYLNTVGLDKIAKGGEGIIKAGLTEGAENVLQDVGTMIADQIYSGKDSDIGTMYRNAIDSGMSEEDALKYTASNVVKQLGMSFGTGSVFGGLFSAAKNGIDIPRLKNDVDVIGEKQRFDSDLTNERIDLEDSSYADFAENNNRVYGTDTSSNTDRAIKETIEQARRENPELLGRLSDEDVYNYLQTRNEMSQSDLDNQNYETLYNIFNNTDSDTAVPRQNGDAGGLELLNGNSTDLITDFRLKNPELSRNMSAMDIMDYIRKTNDVPALSKVDIEKNNVLDFVDSYQNRVDTSDIPKLEGIKTAVNKYYETGQLFNLVAADRLGEKISDPNVRSDFKLELGDLIAKQTDDVDSPYARMSSIDNGSTQNNTDLADELYSLWEETGDAYDIMDEVGTTGADNFVEGVRQDITNGNTDAYVEALNNIVADEDYPIESRMKAEELIERIEGQNAQNSGMLTDEEVKALVDGMDNDEWRVEDEFDTYDIPTPDEFRSMPTERTTGNVDYDASRFYSDTSERIKFGNDADTKAYANLKQRVNSEISKLYDGKAKTREEIGEILSNLDKLDKESADLFAKGNVENILDNGKIAKAENFYTMTKGDVIHLTDDVRQSFTDDGIIQLNNKLNFNGQKDRLKYSATKGVPIDQYMHDNPDVARVCGINLGDSNNAGDSSADMALKLTDYIASLKGEKSDVKVESAEGTRLIDDDAWLEIANRASEVSNGNYAEMAEDVGLNDNMSAAQLLGLEGAYQPRPMEQNIPRLGQISDLSRTNIDADGTIRYDSGRVNEHRYSNSNLQGRDTIPDDIKAEIKNDLYEVLSNKGTEEAASYLTQTYDTNDAYSMCLDMIETKDPVAVAFGYQTARRLINEGKRDEAVYLIRRMSDELTKSGQFSQAAAIGMMQSDPMTALRYMEKQIDTMNDQGRNQYGKKWKDFALTDDEIDAFNNVDVGDTEAIKSLYGQVSKRLEKEYPSTMWEKFVEAQKLAMLLNPRTHIRNTAANAFLIPVRSLSDRVSALGQNVARLFDNNVDVTQSLTGGTRLQKRLAGEVFDNEFKALLDGGDKWNDLNGAKRSKQVFKDNKAGWMATEGAYQGVNLVNKLTGGKLEGVLDTMDESMTDSVMENLRKFDYWLLGEVEDNPFVKKNFQNRLASYMNAQGINSLEDIPNEAKAIAWEEALKATFKDDNNFTNMLSSVKKNLGKFGEVLFPFTKTPANLAMRAVDYSPVGLANAMRKYYNQPITSRNVAKLWDDMSKGLVGTGGILAGYALAKSGAITGALSEDKDTQSFQKQQGKQAYSIKIGDTYLSYDWIQPAATPLVMGAAMYDAIQNSDDENASTLEKVKNGAVKGAKGAMDVWFAQSPLQTVQELLSGDSYGSTSGGIADRMVNTVTDMPQRLIPALMGATARTVDPTMRETYDKTSAWNTYKNTAMSKIPGLSDNLPAKYDTWGNERNRSNSTKGAAFAQYLNPGQLSNSNITPIDNEIGRLGEIDKKAYPNNADWTVSWGSGDNKFSKQLTNQEHSEYQRRMGETSYQSAQTLLNSKAYQYLSDEERTEALSKLYSFSDALAKSEMFGYDIANSSTYSKMYEEYRTNGVDGVVNSLANKAILDKQASNYKDKNGKSKTFSTLSMQEQSQVVRNLVNTGVMSKEDAFGYLKDNDKFIVMKGQTKDALDKYGTRGQELYADLVTNALDDNGSLTINSVLPYLKRNNIDANMAGDVLYSIGKQNSNTDKIDSIVGEVGTPGLLTYYDIKQNADGYGPGGNNNNYLSNDEIKYYIDSLNLTQSQKKYWFDKLKAKSTTKNPF